MGWEKETIAVLVEAAPTWSKKYGYLICTAGLNEKGEWRRLYPMPLDIVLSKIRRWDLIEVETTKPEHDARKESRKINPDLIIHRGKSLIDREEKRSFLNNLSEKSLDSAQTEKRTLTMIKPEVLDFYIEERKEERIQLTLNGKPFRKQPYGDIGLFYRWKCPVPCKGCIKRPHMMECFDWGANQLWKRYEANPEEAKEKVTRKLFFDMRDRFDTWFALGTHSRYPFLRWMIIGLFWFKK